MAFRALHHMRVEAYVTIHRSSHVLDDIAAPTAAMDPIHHNQRALSPPCRTKVSINCVSASNAAHPKRSLPRLQNPEVGTKESMPRFGTQSAVQVLFVLADSSKPDDSCRQYARFQPNIYMTKDFSPTTH